VKFDCSESHSVVANREYTRASAWIFKNNSVQYDVMSQNIIPVLLGFLAFFNQR